MKYFTWSHNVEGCLRNGSYCRVDGRGNGKRNVIVQYMNGDCMGEIRNVPKGMTEVPASEAKSLLPKCCR